MLFGMWSWILLILVIAVIFYANKLPELRAEAEKKLQEGKVLYEKSRKELEAKATVLKEKQQAVQQKIKEKSKAKKAVDVDEDKEITIEDLAFMPEQQDKDKKKSKK